ncbi:MAG: glycoside hydrolase family protein [Caulobacterales bacterium]|nr:glycoside hydrolase family protein [Caulobacterales bacterium]
MKPRHQVSRAAIELIKKFEGYRHKAAQLPDGRWTIGYGHTLTARQGAEVSEADAEALLMYDLIAVAHAVNEHSYTPLVQNQFDALCCFAFNVGVDNFRRSSVLRRVNEGQLLQAACAMEMWRKADFEGERIVIDALVRRRAAEKTLFLTPANGWIPAPSPVLAPKVDYDAVNSVPRQTPTALKASLTGDRTSVVRDETPAPQPVPPRDEPLASEVAAASVGARLEQLMPEAVDTVDPVAAPVLEEVAAPVEDVPAEPGAWVQPEPEPEPYPQHAAETPFEETAAEVAPEPEPYTEPVYPQSAPIIVGSSLAFARDTDFSLTPAPEVTVENVPQDALRADLPEPANESGPGLFDVAMSDMVMHGAPTRPLMSEDYVRRLVREDEMAIMAEFDPVFADTPMEPVRFNGLPLVLTGLGGVVLLAGGIAMGLSAADGDGLLSVRNLGWLLALAGILLAAVAINTGLTKLLGAPVDDEDEEGTEAEWEPRQ